MYNYHLNGTFIIEAPPRRTERVTTHHEDQQTCECNINIGMYILYMVFGRRRLNPPAGLCMPGGVVHWVGMCVSEW